MSHTLDFTAEHIHSVSPQTDGTMITRITITDDSYKKLVEEMIRSNQTFLFNKALEIVKAASHIQTIEEMHRKMQGIKE